MFGSGKDKDKQPENQEKNEKLRVPASIPECEKLVRDIFGNSSDLIIGKFETSREQALVVYINGMTDKDLINRDIITPLKSETFGGDVPAVLNCTYLVTDDMHIVIEKVISGETAVFYGSGKKAYLIDIHRWEHRAVEEPTAETVIRGPREGFNENIIANTVLVRRKIKTPELRFEEMTIGRQTRTRVIIAYINGIGNREVLSQVRERLNAISIDMILETGHIEQLIEKNIFSPVSGIGVTQKPDILAEKLMRGQIGVLVDGTPHALVIPEMFMDNFRTADDNYVRPVFSTMLRIVRGIGLFITCVIPGLSVAILTYNPEMIPPVFLGTMVSSTIKTPLNFSAEILLLTAMFEVVKEAGTRLPKAIGSAVTIVGSLIVGDEAVRAGIVSAPSVIIVAMAAIASFMLPNLNSFIIFYRLLYWALGSFLGIIGIAAGFFIMMTQLISTESFGIPILSSFSKSEMKDSLLMFPLRSMKNRPTSYARENVRKQR